MEKSHLKLPFRLGATSMVFGDDLLENAGLLVSMVDNIEIILFHTPTLQNIPTTEEIHALKKICEEEDVTFTVHLPASLEVAAPDRERRMKSVQLAREILLRTAELEPMYYILHVPFSPPTLVSTPGLYFEFEDNPGWDEWTNRTLESLEILHNVSGNASKLLVENINYSTRFLEPFLENGFCELCLDLGHLILGQEEVMDHLKQYLAATREIHLHGVDGHEEHLSLSRLPEDRVQEWLRYIHKSSFQGVITLEVFSHQDLEESLEVVNKSFFNE